MHPQAIQENISDNHCVGCGTDNGHGLRIKSFWCGELETRCTFEPQPHMAAAHPAVLNGGVIATLIDCHAVCTAISYAQRLAGESGSREASYATSSLEIRYRRPAPIAGPVEVRARIAGVAERKTVLECTLTAAGEVCAEATVVAVRVPQGWADRLQRVPPPAQTVRGWRPGADSDARLAGTA
jgi:acyl-coenzyme A thioesterase PaaI-like protein